MNILMQQQWRTAQGPRRATLTGWGKWMVLLMFPFSVLAIDTWLGTETLKKDYEIAELNRDAKLLYETRETLKLQEAEQITQDRIAMEAPDLGLIEPQPGQIKVVYYAEAGETALPDSTEHAQATSNTDTQIKVSSRKENSLGKENSARGVEDKPWNTDPNTKPQVPMPLAARLHEAIANVYASCLGDS